MYINYYHLDSTITAFYNFIKKINTGDDRTFENNKEKVIYYLNKACKLIEDIELFIDEERRTHIINRVLIHNEINKIKNINGTGLNTQLFTIASDIMTRLNRAKSIYIYSEDIIRDYYDRNVEQEFNAEKIKTIVKAFRLPNRNILYFNPCSYSKTEDSFLKSMIDNLKMYAVVPEEYIDDVDFEEDIYEKIIIEKIRYINDASIKKNTKISNGVFDILNVSPEISTKVHINNSLYSYPSKEFVALKDNLKFLRKNGLLFYTIPYTRLTYEMALFLSKNLKNINIIKYNDQYKKITIIGEKEQVKDYQDTYNSLKNLHYEDIMSSNDFKYKYMLPNGEKTIDLFRGGMLNKKELDKIVTGDNLYNEFYTKINDTRILTDTRPLLPFNVGQVGLVLTSGKLDGIVEEPKDNRHIIKGRTIKYEEAINSESNNDEEIEKNIKISNIVQINAFDGEGNYITIN